MLNNSEKDFLYLLGCALHEETPVFDHAPDYRAVFTLSDYHSLAPLLNPAIQKSNAPEKARKAFDRKYCQNVMKTTLFDEERPKILAEFERNGIRYVPLKGIIVNGLYPFYGSREFSDNDILVDPKKRKTVNRIMKERGYECEVGNVHDEYLRKPCFNFEMHLRLFEKSHNRKKLNDYYEKHFPTLLKDEGNDYGYHFNDNDFFVYLVAHAYKHYGYAGNGIRYLIDFRQYILAHPELDHDYIDGELRKMDILSFFRDSMSLSHALFDHPVQDPVLSEAEEKTLSYILGSGTYGVLQNSVNESMRENGGSRTRYILSRLFIPYSSVQILYPFIARTYVFLPLVPLLRVFKAIRLRKTAKAELDAVSAYKKKEKKH